MLGRREFLGGAAALGLAGIAPARAQSAAPFGGEAFAAAVRAEERAGGGRLGVAILDTGTGQRFAHRGGERFPLTSTFKLVLAGALLAEVDRGRERLDRAVPIAPSDLVPHAPLTEKHVGSSLTVAELCEAVITISDNPAANLLLPIVGGPAGLTGFARGLGDPAFRLDRTEPALNQATPGDRRDTTTPEAMLVALHALLVGEALSPASRRLLTGWLIASRTGAERMRAGLPADWRGGDKTGSGRHGTTNDVAILWPPGHPPILVAAYLTESAAPPPARNAALAAVGRAVVAAVA